MADFKRICSYKLICHSIGTESTAVTDSESTSESSTMKLMTTFMPFVSMISILLLVVFDNRLVLILSLSVM